MLSNRQYTLIDEIRTHSVKLDHLHFTIFRLDPGRHGRSVHHGRSVEK
jgi:hypothetical protein